MAAANKTATPKGKKLRPNENKHVCNLKRTQSDFTTLLLGLKIALKVFVANYCKLEDIMQRLYIKQEPPFKIEPSPGALTSPPCLLFHTPPPEGSVLGLSC